MTPPLANAQLTLVDSWQDVQDFYAWLPERRRWLGVDIETTGLDVSRDRIRLVQIGDPMHGWVFPIEGWGWGAVVKDALEHYGRPIVMQNAIFDSSFLKRDGINVPWYLIDDTKIMSHLWQSGYGNGLKAVARREVDEHATSGEFALKEAMKKQGWTWETVPVLFGPYWKYSGLDPILTTRIAEIQAERVFPRWRAEYDIEMGAMGVLRDAQLTGMRIDVDHAKAESLRLEAEMAQLEPDLPVNPRSHPQLEYWMQQQGAILPKKTEAGADAVDDEVLKMNEDRIPACRTIREWKKRDKLKTNYFDNMLEHALDGVVRPNINPIGASATGRMSIQNPPLQTLPKSKVGRTAFIAREGMSLIAADFDGQEMRMLAHMSQCKKMLELFHEGIDMHAWAAEQVYGDVTKARRQVAKAVGFAKVYGAGNEKLAATAGVSVDEIERFLAQYNALFPEVDQFMQNNMREIDRGEEGFGNYGMVETWSGRRLMVPRDESYKATNYKIQGGCATMTKEKIAEMGNAGLAQYIRLPVHDEVISEAPDDIAEEVSVTISEVMSETDRFSVPFPVTPELTNNWGALYD